MATLAAVSRALWTSTVDGYMTTAAEHMPMNTGHCKIRAKNLAIVTMATDIMLETNQVSSHASFCCPPSWTVMSVPDLLLLRVPNSYKIPSLYYLDNVPPKVGGSMSCLYLDTAGLSCRPQVPWLPWLQSAVFTHPKYQVLFTFCVVGIQMLLVLISNVFKYPAVHQEIRLNPENVS